MFVGRCLRVVCVRTKAAGFVGKEEDVHGGAGAFGGIAGLVFPKRKLWAKEPMPPK